MSFEPSVPPCKMSESEVLANLSATVSLLQMRLEKVQSDSIENNNAFFMLSMGLIIFFMQCGFAFLEAGAVRSKNTTNILIKNVLDSCIVIIAYWATGGTTASLRIPIYSICRLGIRLWRRRNLPL